MVLGRIPGKHKSELELLGEKEGALCQHEISVPTAPAH